MRNRQPLGRILLDHQLLTPEELERALMKQRESGGKLGQVLVEEGYITPVELLRSLAQQFGVPSVDLDEYPVDPTLARMIPLPLARRHGALAVGREEGALVVAMANPSDVLALDDIRSVTGEDVKPVLAEAMQLLDTLERSTQTEGEVEAAIHLAVKEGDADEEDVAGDGPDSVDDRPIVRFVDLLISRAVAERASDIHLEPTGSGLRIRFRVDGVLRETMRAPRQMQAGVVSRLKVMSGVNIAERRLPQDGRVSLVVRGSQVEVRVATVPTSHGEAVVLRLLDRSGGLLKISSLGFGPENLSRFEAGYRQPWGAVFVTGPTGSGKSTTLYSALQEINRPDRSLMTVEDPVEYQVDGVKQVQVNRKAGLTFASALRSFLRADPDVIMVGEVRDRETASIAIEAALTGHLVLSSLHTNDAASTPARLVDMGVEPFLVTSALRVVLAQRLARRLCERCAEPYEPTESELLEAGWHQADLEREWPKLQRPVGCPQCGGSGYRGRFAVHEVMPMTEEVGQLVIARARSAEVRALAVEQGMVTLAQDGLRKVAMGLTSLQELFRVVE